MPMNHWFAWHMVPNSDGARGFHFERVEGRLPDIGEDEALVEVAGCGICGTDLSYFYGEVPTTAPPPLALGHEASGRVLRGGGLEGRRVVVPTVIPCRTCELCRSGRANRCLRQKMLGGNYSAQGAFASHVVVPWRELALIPDDCAIPLERMAVIADAVSTPYQAVRRAAVGPGDKVVVIGATGGLGVYLVQWAKLMGAELVVGVARDAAKLESLRPYGLDAAAAVSDRAAEAARHEMWRTCNERRLNPRSCWKLFEASGSLAGQRLGIELLTFASKLTLVGYAAGEITLSLSKVMAYDAEIVGSWGCDPRHYGEVIRHVTDSKIQIIPFTETRSMARIVESFEEVRARKADLRRIVLTSDWIDREVQEVA